MASRLQTVGYLVDQMSDAGEVTVRKMFGEYTVYCGGKVVALICDDRLFVKLTPTGRNFTGPVPEAPPYPGAKACLLIDPEKWEDRDWLSTLIRLTSGALPEPKKKGRTRRL